MKRRLLLPTIAALGLMAGIMFALTRGQNPAPAPNQLSLPPSSPYAETVSGTGIVEASSRNIAVGSHLPGIVESVLVVEGDVVEQNAPLFRLDTRSAQAEVAMKQAEVATAKASAADAQDQWQRAQELKMGVTISEEQRQRRKFAALRAQAEVERAEAALKLSEVSLEHLTVTSPIAGKILKTRVRPGEFVAAGTPITQSPILIGQDHPLHLRVTIDENDAWRFAPNSKAIAALRSNKEISFPLTFVRIEPYVLPKSQLSGDTAERVDTRVLEVIYALEPGEQPIYIGQQMDVFLEVAKTPESK